MSDSLERQITDFVLGALKKKEFMTVDELARLYEKTSKPSLNFSKLFNLKGWAQFLRNKMASNVVLDGGLVSTCDSVKSKVMNAVLELVQNEPGGSVPIDKIKDLYQEKYGYIPNLIRIFGCKSFAELLDAHLSDKLRIDGVHVSLVANIEQRNFRQSVVDILSAENAPLKLNNFISLYLQKYPKPDLNRLYGSPTFSGTLKCHLCDIIDLEGNVISLKKSTQASTLAAFANRWRRVSNSSNGSHELPIESKSVTPTETIVIVKTNSVQLGNKLDTSGSSIISASTDGGSSRNVKSPSSITCDQLKERIVNLVRDNGPLTLTQLNAKYQANYGEGPWRKYFGCRLMEFITNELSDNVDFAENLLKIKTDKTAAVISADTMEKRQTVQTNQPPVPVNKPNTRLATYSKPGSEFPANGITQDDVAVTGGTASSKLKLSDDLPSSFTETSEPTAVEKLISKVKVDSKLRDEIVKLAYLAKKETQLIVGRKAMTRDMKNPEVIIINMAKSFSADYLKPLIERCVSEDIACCAIDLCVLFGEQEGKLYASCCIENHQKSTIQSEIDQIKQLLLERQRNLPFPEQPVRGDDSFEQFVVKLFKSASSDGQLCKGFDAIMCHDGDVEQVALILFDISVQQKSSVNKMLMALGSKAKGVPYYLLDLASLLEEKSVTMICAILHQPQQSALTEHINMARRWLCYFGCDRTFDHNFGRFTRPVHVQQFSSLFDFLDRIRYIVHLSSRDLTLNMLQKILADLYGFSRDPLNVWGASWEQIFESFLVDISHNTTEGWKLISPQSSMPTFSLQLFEYVPIGLPRLLLCILASEPNGILTSSQLLNKLQYEYHTGITDQHLRDLLLDHFKLFQTVFNITWHNDNSKEDEFSIGLSSGFNIPQ